jgi:hypothetical protein
MIINLYFGLPVSATSCVSICIAVIIFDLNTASAESTEILEKLQNRHG